MSIIELGSMLKECRVIGTQIYYYKYPKIDWIRGEWNLETNSDVVEMCELVRPSKLVLVSVVGIKLGMTCIPEENLTQEYKLS